MIDLNRPVSLNMNLLAHHTLDGLGGMGEGVSIQCLPQGRRVLWIAHENAPKNFTPVDVTEPRAPRVLVQTELPHASMRSNSLDVSGNLMAVAYQVSKPGLAPAGFELFDIGVPEDGQREYQEANSRGGSVRFRDRQRS